MRRRLDLAASLLGRPEVLFLDEPTTGLDPRSRQATCGRSSGDSAASGITVFLTTQYLEEADSLADRIAVLDGGAIVAEGTTARTQAAGRRSAAGPGAHDAGRVRQLLALPGDRIVHVDRELLTLGVATDGAAPDVRRLLDELDPQRSRGRPLLARPGEPRRRVHGPDRPPHRHRK